MTFPKFFSCCHLPEVFLQSISLFYFLLTVSVSEIILFFFFNIFLSYYTSKIEEAVILWVYSQLCS